MPKSRRELPAYATDNSVRLTQGQMRRIHPKGGKAPFLRNAQETVKVAKTKDDLWWAEWRGDTVLWAHRWHRIPATVGKRAEKIENAIKEISNA
jgi:hypothetical protein